MSAPITPPLNLEQVPVELMDLNRWVLWRDVNGRKRPFTRTGASASVADPATWCSFIAAFAAYQAGTYTGVGVVLGEGLVGIDLDDVRDPATGEIHPDAQRILEHSGSYAEVSPSGTGLKIFGSGQWAGFPDAVVDGKKRTSKNRRPFADGEIEVYGDVRYFTVTGRKIGDGTFRDLTPTLELLRSEFAGDAPPEPKIAAAIAAPTTPHTPTVLVEDKNPLLGDDQIIAIASRSKNGDAFTKLWNGDTSEQGGDHSNADLTLCQYLAFYTHDDPARLDRLFRRSKLYRDKWERSDYRNRTIMLAISSCRKFWDPSNIVPFDNPHRLAEQFLEENPTLKNLNETYYVWSEGAYVEVRLSVVRGEVTNLVKKEFELGYQEAVARHAASTEEKKKPPRLEPVTVTVINNVMQALAGLCTVAIDPPCWLEDVGGPEPSQMIAFRNGLLDLVTGQFFESTPAFFTFNAMPYDYDSAALEPVEWLKFLESIWIDDCENIQAIQEWFGYSITHDNRYQKIMFLVGPSRSGKGTILKALEGVVGSPNTASLTLSGLAGPFGGESLLGKRVAVIPDARFAGDRTESAVVVERLLTYSGDDLVAQNRKFKSPITIRPRVRFTICSNELPELRDSSVAIAERFLILRFTQSFLGREDVTLGDRIARELPGIFNWSLLGLRRLHDRGKFLQPATGATYKQELRDLASPISVFVREECVFEPRASVPKQELFDHYLKHAAEHGWSHTSTKERFGKDLRAVWPRREDAYLTVGGKRVHVWCGIRLKTTDEKEQPGAATPSH